MDRNSNVYTISYAAVVTVIVATVLAVLSMSLKAKHEANEALATKKAIMGAVGLGESENIEQLYADKVESLVLKFGGEVVNDTAVKAEKIKIQDENKKPKEERYYPLFVFTGDNGNKKYIVPLYGNGLWDKIWGYVAIKDDFNTIEGISFDHKSETPGLGAEIKDNPDIPESFIGKKLFDGDEYKSVKMKKGVISDPNHQVDAISGATITGDGVSDMMYEDTADYMAYFKSIK